jgi:hypothetical protein
VHSHTSQTNTTCVDVGDKAAIAPPDCDMSLSIASIGTCGGVARGVLASGVDDASDDVDALSELGDAALSDALRGDDTCFADTLLASVRAADVGVTVGVGAFTRALRGETVLVADVVVVVVDNDVLIDVVVDDVVADVLPLVDAAVVVVTTAAAASAVTPCVGLGAR